MAYFQNFSGNARTPDTGVENEGGVDEAGKAEKASKPKVKGVGKASKKITNPDLDDTSLELEATKAIKKGEQREKNKKTVKRKRYPRSLSPFGLSLASHWPMSKWSICKDRTYGLSSPAQAISSRFCGYAVIMRG